jgi:hypothetical protein
VNNNTAKENVTRVAESMGWQVVVQQQDADIILNLSK